MKFGDYLFEEEDMLNRLWLLIEGASAIYETDTQPICGLAMNGNQLEALVAFEAIGTALTDIRDCIHAFKDAHIKAVAAHVET